MLLLSGLGPSFPAWSYELIPFLYVVNMSSVWVLAALLVAPVVGGTISPWTVVMANVVLSLIEYGLRYLVGDIEDPAIVRQVHSPRNLVTCSIAALSLFAGAPISVIVGIPL